MLTIDPACSWGAAHCRHCVGVAACTADRCLVFVGVPGSLMSSSSGHRRRDCSSGSESKSSRSPWPFLQSTVSPEFEFELELELEFKVTFHLPRCVPDTRGSSVGRRFALVEATGEATRYNDKQATGSECINMSELPAPAGRQNRTEPSLGIRTQGPLSWECPDAAGSSAVAGSPSDAIQGGGVMPFASGQHYFISFHLKIAHNGNVIPCFHAPQL